MNGIYFKYLFADLRSDRKQLLSEMSVYTVFAVLMSLIITVFVSFSRSYNDYIENKFGLYDGFAVDVSDEKLVEASKNAAIDNYAEIGISGYIESISDKSDPVTIGAISDNAFKLLNLSLLSGRMPEKDGEIVVEQSIKNRLGDNISSDGKVILNVFDFIGGSHEITFTVVGVVSDYVYNHSKLVRELGTKSLPDKQLPGIILKENSFPVIRLVLADVSGGNSESETLASLSDTYFLNYGHINRADDSVYELITSVTVLVLITGILFLYGNLRLRRNRYAVRTKKLKLCGLTNRNVFSYRAASLVIPVLASSILGTLAGVFISWLVVLWMQGFVDFMAFHASIAVYSAITLFDAAFVIVVSLIYEAVLISKRPLLIYANRNEKDVMHLSPSFFKKHPLMGWSMKSHSYYSKKHSAIFLCIILIGVAVNFGGSTLIQTMRGMESGDLPYDYKLNCASSFVSIDAIDMPTGSNAVLEQQDVSLILSSDEVENAVAFSFSAVHILDERLANTNTFPLLAPTMYTNEKTLLTLLENYGYSSDEKLYRAYIMHCNEEFISGLLKLSGSEKSKLEKGEAILCINGDSLYSAGDEVNLTQPVYTTNKRVDTKVKIASVIDYDLVPEGYRKANTFYICDPDFPLLPDGGKYKIIDIVLRDKTEYSKTEEAISQINALYNGSVSVISNRQNNAEVQAVGAATSVLCFLIISVFAIYCVINICGMVSEKLYANRASWSILRINGVGKYSALGMLFAETAITVFSGMLTSTVFFYGIILCCGDISTVITPLASILTLLILLAICFICVWNAVRVFWNASVLKMIRDVG